MVASVGKYRVIAAMAGVCHKHVTGVWNCFSQLVPFLFPTFHLLLTVKDCLLAVFLSVLAARALILIALYELLDGRTY